MSGWFWPTSGCRTEINAGNVTKSIAFEIIDSELRPRVRYTRQDNSIGIACGKTDRHPYPRRRY